MSETVFNRCRVGLKIRCPSCEADTGVGRLARIRDAPPSNIASGAICEGDKGTSGPSPFARPPCNG